MRNIFIGLLFIFIDFHIDLGAARIGLIPDFVGYIFMIKGLDELASQSGWFTKARPFATGMLAYTAILYAMDLFGIWLSLGAALSIVVGLISIIISLYVSYCIVMGVSEMEKTLVRDLNAGGLYKMWTFLAIFSIIPVVIFFIPVLGVISIIVSLIAAICFLVSFSKSKNMYEAGSL